MRQLDRRVGAPIYKPQDAGSHAVSSPHGRPWAHGLALSRMALTDNVEPLTGRSDARSPTDLAWPTLPTLPTSCGGYSNAAPMRLHAGLESNCRQARASRVETRRIGAMCRLSMDYLGYELQATQLAQRTRLRDPNSGGMSKRSGHDQLHGPHHPPWACLARPSHSKLQDTPNPPIITGRLGRPGDWTPLRP